MSAPDVLVAAVVLVSALLGFRAGLVRVVLWLAGWAGAVIATVYGFAHLRPLAAQWTGEGIVADLVAIVVLFVVSFVALTYLKQRIAGVVRDSALSALDRTLGLGAGFLIGVTLVSGAYLAGQSFGLTDRWEFYRDARSLPLVRQSAAMLLSLSPAGWTPPPPPAPETDETGTDRRFRTLLSPQAAPATPPEKEPGYSTDERKAMDRLFDTHR